MILIVQELQTTLLQKILVGSDPINTYCFRPHLYVHNAPAGSLKLQLLDANQRLIENSETIAISTIRTAFSTPNYLHADVRFLIDAPLQADTNYYIQLASTGYTYAAGDFVGWCQDFDLRKVQPSVSVPYNGYNSPLMVEVWGKKNSLKGDSL